MLVGSSISVCSASDKFTVFLCKTLSCVDVAGRLDFNTRGLLVLTNNSELASVMENPRSKLKRRYIACVRGRVGEPNKKKLPQRRFPNFDPCHA